jgi:hypothetical protein
MSLSIAWLVLIFIRSGDGLSFPRARSAQTPPSVSAMVNGTTATPTATADSRFVYVSRLHQHPPKAARAATTETVQRTTTLMVEVVPPVPQPAELAWPPQSLQDHQEGGPDRPAAEPREPRATSGGDRWLPTTRRGHSYVRPDGSRFRRCPSQSVVGQTGLGRAGSNPTFRVPGWQTDGALALKQPTAVAADLWPEMRTCD